MTWGVLGNGPWGNDLRLDPPNHSNNRSLADFIHTLWIVYELVVSPVFPPLLKI
jgi:hypothetical protein